MPQTNFKWQSITLNPLLILLISTIIVIAWGINIEGHGLTVGVENKADKYKNEPLVIKDEDIRDLRLFCKLRLDMIDTNIRTAELLKKVQASKRHFLKPFVKAGGPMFNHGTGAIQIFLDKTEEVQSICYHYIDEIKDETDFRFFSKGEAAPKRANSF